MFLSKIFPDTFFATLPAAILPIIPPTMPPTAAPTPGTGITSYFDSDMLSMIIFKPILRIEKYYLLDST